MPRVEETAYPRLKSTISPRDLALVYTPNWDEAALASRSAKGASARLGFLVLFKTYQRLGYPIPLSDVPEVIVAHIARSVDLPTAALDAAAYDAAGTRRRHLAVIRDYLRVRPFGPAARHVLVRALGEAARTKGDLIDLINVAIEELLHQHYELPAFYTLEEAARKVRAVLNRQLYRQVFAALTPVARLQIDALFIADLSTRRTPWHDLKSEPGRPTRTHLKDLIAHERWLSNRTVGASVLAGIPAIRVEHLAAEARSLDAARMMELEPHKRYTLAAALLCLQTGHARDDLGTMFIRLMQRINAAGKQALAAHREEAAPRTDALVGTLRDLVVAHGQEGSVAERMAAMDAVIGGHGATLIEECDAHLALAGSNYYPFLWRCYRSQRATLLTLLRTLTLRTTTQETGVQEALRFLQENAGRSGASLPTARAERTATGERRQGPLLDLSWIPDGWWRLVTGERTRGRHPARVDRRHFEVCVCMQVFWDLKAGDLCIVGSTLFADYTHQLLPLDTYQRHVDDYCQMLGFPAEGPRFAAHVRAWLEDAARNTDQTFPANKALRIESGEPILTPVVARPDPESLPELEAVLTTRLPPVGILQALAATVQWLGWDRFFGPLSGHDAKLERPRARYVSTVFGYGCHIGPAPLARAIDGLDRRQIIWINQRHISEDALDRVIREVVDRYHRFTLPYCWGSPRRLGADGTHWALYEDNLLSERHVRYGDYGGIAYYHVAGTYIARFSHFISCGALEGSYILDPFFAPDAHEEAPEALHSDTHGQSTTIFGLAYLLGIQLYPRIRGWKKLIWCRPSPESHYTHIDALFTETVDWDVIATHLPDMLRVALSIKEGLLTPSTILRRLGTYSRKNRLYHAFFELGRAVRTGFLLRYIADPELQATIHAAMNKNESFNHFVQWVAFGDDGTITENDRLEQRKSVKYTHVVANCLIFYTVAQLSRALAQLHDEGYPLDPEAVAALSPYRTAHLDRFGHYTLDLTQMPEPLEYDLPIFSAATP